MMKYADVPAPDAPGPDRLPPQRPAVALPEDYDFNRLLDNACDRLRMKKAELSMRRIRHLEGELAEIERDLDIFLERQEAR
jgi:hypothetical protein